MNEAAKAGELQECAALPGEEESFDDSQFLDGFGAEDGSDGLNDPPDLSPEEEGEGEAGERSEEPPEEAPQETFLTIEIGGESRQLTREETQNLALRGMEYDQLQAQADELRAERVRMEAELSHPRAETAVLPLLRAYAKAAGGDLDSLTSQMMQAVQQAGIAIEQPHAENYMQQKAVRDWQEFLKAYPDITDPKTQLPREVWDRIGKGVSPQYALIEHRQADLQRQIAERDATIKELERREQAHQQNEKNKKKAVGSLTSTAAGDVDDGFLSGFTNG